MLFSSFIFLFGFLPFVLFFYFLAPRAVKNSVLLLASYLFYAWGAPKVAPLLLLSSLLDYAVVRRMERSEEQRRALCLFGVIVNLALLAYYKYANFFIAQLSVIGTPIADWVEIVLPIGISFFTFQKISYIVDVYRRRSEPARTLPDYLLYVSLFPQLIAGPILRYHDVELQLKSREHSFELFLFGIVRFSLGLAKKVLLADAVGAVADNAFSLHPIDRSVAYAWLGLISYAFQIYFDFSGYSDMAIGLLAMFGFRIPENFRMPYAAASLTEFWRRWHISLSSWMREYLYIPLGGNRYGALRTAANLWIVFLLSGLWHGASWTFVAWGAVHGFFLSLERLLRGRYALPRALGVSYQWSIVLLSWVLFRAESFEAALSYYEALFGLTTALNPPALGLFMHERARWMFSVCVLLVLVSLHAGVRERVERFMQPPLHAPLLQFALAYALFLLAVVTLSTTAFNPFIYFRF